MTLREFYAGIDGSYDEALGVIGDYVNITDGSESEDFDEGHGMSL